MSNYLPCVRHLHPVHFTSESVTYTVPADQGPEKPFLLIKSFERSRSTRRRVLFAFTLDTSVEMMDANLQGARPRFFWVGLGHTPALSAMLFLHFPVCLALISLWFPLLQDLLNYHLCTRHFTAKAAI